MRVTTILSGLVAVAAGSIGITGIAGSAQAEPDDVVLKGRVVDTTGKPLEGVAVRCDLDGKPGPFVVTGTDADGTYSFTRSAFDEADPDHFYRGCEYVWFFDPSGRYITTSWPSGDGEHAGKPVQLPPREGGEPAIANGTLGAGGQLAGSTTDARKRGLFDVEVDVYSTKTRKVVATAQTTPYGGYRVLGLRPGTYKVKIGTGVTHIGYRPAYAGGGSTYDAAKTITVKAGASTAVGRQTLPNTAKLFTSRGAVSLSYARPLVSGTKVTTSGSAYVSTPAAGSTVFVVASRAADPTTGEPDDTLPYASSVWEYVYGDDAQPLVLREGYSTGFVEGYRFRPFAGRRMVVIAVHSRSGYAQTSAVSAPTAVAQ